MSCTPTTQRRQTQLDRHEINGKDHEVKYDLDNRIIKVKIDNTDVKYRYDALGRRVVPKQKTVTKTALIWWGNSECVEYKHNSAVPTLQRHQQLVAIKNQH